MATDELLKLNLGCGFDARIGFVNVDRRDLPGVNVVHDLDQHPWPFGDGSVVEIVAIDSFEHLQDVIGAMNECWRILAPGGHLLIRGPTPESESLWMDVSHRRAFVEHCLDHFDWTTELGQRYRYGIGPWRLMSTRRDGGNIIFHLMRLEAGRD